MLINIDQVVDLCKSTRRTAMKRLIDVEKIKGKGREILVESTIALPIMFGLNDTDKKTLDSERTRLASAQAEKTELEVQVIKGNLIPAPNVETTVNNMVSAFRSKMLSFPTKAAPAVLPLADVAEAESVLRDLVYEALTELSNYDPEQYRTKNDNEGGTAGGSTTKADGKSVGRSKKKTVKGSKRRTRSMAH